MNESIMFIKEKLSQKFLFGKCFHKKSLKRLITHLALLAFINQNLAFATNSIIELDFKDSQTQQRLHVMPRLSNVGDVSHVEIDTEQKQAAVYLKEKQEEALNDLENNSSQGGDVSVTTKPVILQKHDIINLPWELEPEKLTLFILNHTAWLSPLEGDGYKLEFRGSLLGGGGAQSTGGGGGGSSHSSGGGQCRPSVWSECDSSGRCELNITVCNSYNNHNSNDHSISGTSHHGGNDSTGGYGSSGSSGGSLGHGSSGGFVGGYVAPDLSRHPHSTDPTEIAFWQHNIILNYPRDNVMHYLKKNAFISKDDVKDKLLDDALLQVVLDYTGDMSSPMKILLETLSYMARQDLRNMLNGLERTRDYTVPLSKSDALKRLIIMSNMFIDRVSPDFWGVGPGSDCFHWGQLKKINTNSAITKVLVPQLFNKGIDLLKTSGQAVYKGSKYLLTQNAKGNIAMASPYNGLSYPLFAEDRLTGDSYLPHTYVCDPLLDQALWGTVHNYVDGTLSKSLYKTTWKEYRYHTEPAFYVIRTALRDTLEQAIKSEDYTQLALPSSLGQSLQEAVARHIFLTPLFDQDSTLGITQYLTPTLFRKGVEILKKDQQIRNPFFEPYEQFKHIQHLASKEKTWEAVYEYSDPLGYDRELVQSIDWKSTYTFEKYLQCYNPFYQDYRQIKEIHRLINTVTYPEVFKYSTPLGYSEELVQSIPYTKPMPSFQGYMTEAFDDQVLKDWGAYDLTMIPIAKMQKTDPMSPYDFFDLEGKMGGSGMMSGGAGGGKLGWNRIFANQKKLSEQQIKTANNVIQKIQHRTRLQLQDKGILDAKGNLTKKAINESKPIEDLTIKNKEVIKELTKDGSKIVDWKKVATNETITLPNGKKAQVHFYKNIKTGDVNTNIDFKLKADVPIDNRYELFKL